ncbi:MAG: hypothetical protein S4CHLAM7_07460 [Chlamydiae bacterium]|nr:hypothetical protein [Chlamydiota bacterium]
MTTQSTLNSLNPNTYATGLNTSNIDEKLGIKGTYDFYREIEESDSGFWSYFPNWLAGTSAEKTLTWSRAWEEGSYHVNAINNHISCTAQNLDKKTGDCFFNALRRVEIKCTDSSTGSSPLNALSEKVPLHSCNLVLDDGITTTSHSLHKIIINSDRSLKPIQQTQLYSIVNWLRTGVIDTRSASRDIGNINFSNIRKQLGFTAMQSSELGGNFHAFFKAKLSTSNPLVEGLFHPNQATENIPGSYDLESGCSLESTSSSSLKSTCIHQLKNLLKNHLADKISITREIGSSKTTLFGSPQHIKNWYQAFSKNSMLSMTHWLDGLFESSAKISDPSGKHEESIVSHSIGGSSRPLNLPTTEDLGYSLLVPLGVSITAAGVLYAKSNYENAKKTDLRRIIGGIVGVASAILGISIVAVPFNK